MQLFIRVRGRVLGPFDDQKLRSLALRGQFGKMHEVSEDGVTWGRASQYPDLFRAGETAVAVVEVVGEREPRQEANDYAASTPAAMDAPRSMPAAGTWYYNDRGQEMGPTSFTAIQAMLRSGQLSQNSLVWTNGMNQWTPASLVDGLVAAPAIGGNAIAPQQSSGKISGEVVSQLSEVRPWIVFFAVVWTLTAVGSMIGGVVFLIQAAKVSDFNKTLASAFAGQSVGWFVEGVIATVTTFMLYGLAGLIREFTFHRNDQTLERALRKGKQLVVFWGVLTIIAIVIILIAVVYAMAVA